MRKHTGEKPHKCEFCQMAFTQAGNLRSHIKRVHSIETNEPLIKCELCSCTFKKMGSLHAHFSRVHNTHKMDENVEDLPDTNPDSDLLFKALNSTGLPSINPEETNRKIIGSIVIAGNFSTIFYTLGQKSTFHPKIHILKIPIFTKFTTLKSQNSQNSLF